MVGESWLPVPPGWRDLTVEAQVGEPGSMLRLYRDALRIRRELPALGDGVLRWLDGPEDVLVFERDPGFVCAVNFGREPVRLDVSGTFLLSSAVMREGRLAPDSAVWWSRP